MSDIFLKIGVGIVSSLIILFVTWLFSVESRLDANESEIHNSNEVIYRIKEDTNFILCRLGEESRCYKRGIK